MVPIMVSSRREDGKTEGGVLREVEMENIHKIFEKGMYF